MKQKHLCARRLMLPSSALVVLVAAAGWAQNPTPPAASSPQAQPSTPGAPALGIRPAAPSLPQVPPDKVVMKVGDKQITAGQFQAIIQTLPPQVQRAAMVQGLKDVGDQYAKLIAIAEKAAADGLDQKPDVKIKLELQRMQLLAQGEYQKINEDIKITPADVSQYYTDHKSDFEQVEIRQVSVRKKAANAKADAPGLPEADAKAKAEAIRAALASGEDAQKVHDQFKMDNVVFFDPNPHAVRHGQLAGAMDKTAWTLKDGEVSDIQDNPVNVYFLQVVKHNSPTEAEVSKEIEGKIKEEKSKEALDSLENGANVWLDPEYFAAPKPPQAQAAPPAPNAPTSAAESNAPAQGSTPAKPQ
jgi:PPIC-type PPIASE domain